MQNSTFSSASQAFEPDGVGNTSTLTDNSFLGNPAGDYNAINILNGSSTIQQNTISSYNFPPATSPDVSAFGIYMNCVTSGTVNNNHVGGTQVGIYLFNPTTCPTSGVTVTNNKVWGAQCIGIVVGQSNGSVVSNDIRSTQTQCGCLALLQGTPYKATQSTIPALLFNNVLNNTISNAQNLAIMNTTALCPSECQLKQQGYGVRHPRLPDFAFLAARFLLMRCSVLACA